MGKIIKVDDCQGCPWIRYKELQGGDPFCKQTGQDLHFLYIDQIPEWCPLDSGWISVEDRLPPKSDRGFGSDDVLCIEQGQWFVIACYIDGEWRDEEFCEHEVTHWQELPDLPGG
jgi:hypothetical protein